MLGFLRRRPKLAADRRPALDHEERILAWAEAADGQVVVATNFGLWLPERDRLGWHEIHKAAWSGRELRLTAAELAQDRDSYAVMVDAPLVSYLLLEPGEVPEQVRARVLKSVAYTSHHPLPGGGGVRIVARRIPGVDGLTWTVRYDSNEAVDSTAAVLATAELIGQARDASSPAQ
jgi:hypothetical protein